MRAHQRLRAWARHRRRARMSHAQVWQRLLPTEVAFWDTWLRTEGLTWPDAYRRRLDPEMPLTDDLVTTALDRLGRDRVSILDVGAGPVTCLGRRHPGMEIELVAVDPLGATYDELLARHGVRPPVRTLACAGEAIVERFGAERFDIAHARNAVDHSADPALIVHRMVDVVRPGGLVLLRHYLREGVTMRYEELHQWNFDVEDDELVVWSPRTRRNLSRELTGRAEVRCRIEGGSDHAPFVVAEIERL